ncbi:MAG: zeta toxin family protein [Defluviitaleaceae bacterium]|nr:zeta toxin family protein [Defluviitaleaceae bacterium]
MITLIGGVTHAGKTLLAQRLLEKFGFPYLSVDHLKMGLWRAGIGEFEPLDSTEHIALQMWDVLKGMILTAHENRQNLIVEGIYLLPQYVRELGFDGIISLHIGFSKKYIDENFRTKILENRNAIEKRGNCGLIDKENFVSENCKLKELCGLHGANFFEIDGDYHLEMDKIVKWIESQTGQKRERI